MNAPEPTVQEDDLHAYVDGQLPSPRLSAVRRYLDAHPSEAARVAHYSRQRDALREAFRTPEMEPLPPGLNLSRVLEAKTRWRVRRYAAAAAALALIVGGAGGWFLHSSPPPSRLSQDMSVLQEQALAAHAVYAGDRRQLNAIPDNGADVVAQWLSIHLRRKVRPPDLSAAGYQLMGSRLLATGDGNASALFLYQTREGRRLSLLIHPTAPDLKSAEVELSRGEWNTYAWVEDGIGCVLIAAVSNLELDKLADQIKTEFRPG